MTDRGAIILGIRMGGAILFLLGLWMLLGGSLAGQYGFGGVLVVVGLIGLFLIPRLLSKGPR